jgi:hypothetical protein
LCDEQSIEHAARANTMKITGILPISIGLAFASSAFAGYTVTSRVEPAKGGYRYTWTVHNQDQDSGLDVFLIEVPVETRILAQTIPPPYSNPEGSGAQWVFLETHEAQVDPHDNQAWLIAAPPGKKYLLWCGQQPPSVYPPGTSASFSLTTDSSIKPGAVRGVATTYTPQNNPHFYAPFHNRIVGPAAHEVEPGALPTSIFLDVKFLPASSDLSFAPHADSANSSPVNASLDLYPGVTVEGEVGTTYGIQFSNDLDATWRGLANITLSVPKQIWFDPHSASAPRRFYRVLPGPVVVP